MKKLPICALLTGAGFVIAGTILLLQLAPRPSPVPLFLPLVWDLVMVAISVGVVLRCDCARRLGMSWGVFCVIASLAIGAAAFDWLLPQQSEPLGSQRVIFMCVTVGFGLVFSIWQLFAMNSPAVRAWTDPAHASDSHAQPNHG
ncbi:MAG TPA: hypothetical protein VEQ65_07630 [Opitutus sp.]|nr:hypothetical protein [Opitutus sp.]